MNVTRLNFKQVLPILINTIKQSNFVAIDFQMSGIQSSFLLNPSLTDSVQTRYHKTKCKIEKYIPLQLGLCPLKIQKQTKKIIYSPFNIYIYPLALKNSDATQFSFNSQSMKFLAKNNFDFNKLFYQGIPFISQKRLKKYNIKSSQVKQKQKATKQFILQSPDVAAFLKLRMQQIDKWISSSLIEDDKNNSEQAEKTKSFIVQIQFVGVRAYQSLIYAIKTKYPSLSLKFQYLDANGIILKDKNFLPRKYIKITKLTPQQVLQQVKIQNVSQLGSQIIKQVEIQQRQSLVQSFQMNKIWSTIKQENIPLLVHNGFLDIMHLYNQFVDDLPTSQSMYQKCVNKQFPIIFDTKYICNNNPILLNKMSRNTSLGNAFQVLRTLEKQQIQKNKNQVQQNQKQKKQQQNYVSQINPMCQAYNLDSQNCHEAGFDALMTAYTFINSMRAMMQWRQISTKNYASLQYFLNKIPLGSMKVPYNFAMCNQKYEQDKNTQFFFTCLKKQQTPQPLQSFMSKEIQIIKYFNQKFGPIRISWEDKNLYNFVLSFIRPEDQLKFIEKANKQEYFIYSIEKNSKYLVSTKLRRQKQLFVAANNNIS